MPAQLTNYSANSFSPDSDVLVGAASTLDVRGGEASIGSLSGSGTVTSYQTGGTADLTVNESLAQAFSGTVTDQFGSYAAVALTKEGSGTLTLSGDNSFSGGMDVEAGTLRLGNPDALGGGVLTVNGGTLDLYGNSATVTDLTSTNSTGVVTNTSATLAVLSVGGTIARDYFYGSLRDDGVHQLGLTLIPPQTDYNPTGDSSALHALYLEHSRSWEDPGSTYSGTTQIDPSNPHGWATLLAGNDGASAPTPR